MFSKLNWYIAYKYLVSRQENTFVSFIALISTLGVAIGIAILIIVITVLNGFKQHIEAKVLDNEYHLTINYNSTDNVGSLITKLKEIDNNITHVVPLILESGLFTFNNYTLPINISSKPNISDEERNSKDSSYKEKTSNQIDISSNLAKNFNIAIGDKVIIASPVIKNSVLGPQPRFKKFQVNSIYDASNSNNINSVDVVMDYNLALKFFDLDDNYISSLYLSVDEPLQAERTQRKLIASKLFDSGTTIKIWQDFNQNLFQAIKLERIAIILLLLMIITIACLNILSGLFIQVTEKQKDIAILRNLGLNNANISAIFLVQGIIIAIIGGIIGVSLGIIITLNLDTILFWLQQCNLIDSYNNFFNAIVTHAINLNLNYFEIIMIFCMSLFLCMIATIIPARKSSKVSLIEVLRNE